MEAEERVQAVQIVAWHINVPTVMPASHVDAGSNPGGSVSDPLPANEPGKTA